MKFFKKNKNICKFILVGIVSIFLIFPIHSSGLDNGYSRIVYNVSGLQTYQLHWNDRFPPGSTLMIYTEADGINHRRAVGVDYVLIIRDSNDNIVDTIVNSNRYKDYRVDDFTKFSEIIANDLDDGAYVAEVHIFDLLNDSLMDDYYKNVTHALLNGEDKPDIPYMNRSNVTNNPELMARQYKKNILNFYVDKYSNKYPTNRFTIENMALDRESIALGVPIQVNINLKNNFYDKGFASVDLLLDNKVINNATVDIDPYSSKEIMLAVPSEITEFIDYGNHTLKIIPTTDNTIGFNLVANFAVSTMEVEIPIRLQYKDIQTDRLAIRPNETINITVIVENMGRAGTQTVGMNINNIPVEEKSVKLNFSEVRDVNFTVKGTEIGEYRITINDTNLSKVFFVESENVSTNVTKLPAAEKPSKIFILPILFILIFLIYIIRKKFVAKYLHQKENTSNTENIDIDIEDFKKRVE